MKPRNYIVIALLKSKRKSGKHIKTEKAIRRKEKVNYEKMVFKQDNNI